MRLLTAALVLFATPTLAETWADQSCGIALLKDGAAYTYVVMDKNETPCVARKDKSGAVKLTCGPWKGEVKADDEIAVMEGVELIRVTDTGPVCD